MDFPVGWATFALALATLTLALLAYLSLRETKAQRIVMGKQAETMREQTEIQIKPRVDLYHGVPESMRNAAPIVWYIVVRNAKGGGPAKNVRVVINNSTRNTDGSTTFPLLEVGEEKSAGVPAGTEHGDTLDVMVEYKDILDRDYELKANYKYQGTQLRNVY